MASIHVTDPYFISQFSSWLTQYVLSVEKFYSCNNEKQDSNLKSSNKVKVNSNKCLWNTFHLVK